MTWTQSVKNAAHWMTFSSPECFAQSNTFSLLFFRWMMSATLGPVLPQIWVIASTPRAPANTLSPSSWERSRNWVSRRTSLGASTLALFLSGELWSFSASCDSPLHRCSLFPLPLHQSWDIHLSSKMIQMRIISLPYRQVQGPLSADVWIINKVVQFLEKSNITQSWMETDAVLDLPAEVILTP